MNICVAGHFVLDELHLHNGEIVESYGGIHFALCAFSGIVTEKDLVCPVFPLGEEVYRDVLDRFSRLRRVSFDGLYRVPAPATRVKLFYSTPTAYTTCLVTELPPVDWERIKSCVDSDLLYLNMMTARDIALPTLERFRAESGALIYLDTHMLSYRVTESGRREFASPAGWDRWARSADIIQMNEREILHFTGEERMETEAVNRIFSAGETRAVVVTRGEAGATIYSRPCGALERTEIAAAPVERIADTTGCGDSFGSAFAYRYACGDSIPVAGRFAALVASICAQVHGSEGLEQLPVLLGVDAV